MSHTMINPSSLDLTLKSKGTLLNVVGKESLSLSLSKSTIHLSTIDIFDHLKISFLDSMKNT